MQIYELTQSKKTKLNEANPLAAATGAVGSGVSALKRAGTAIASPFKDAGSAYTSGQISAKTNALADKAFRAWSQYANQRMTSMDDTEKQAYVSGADGNMKKDLTAFVQKNMLGNQPFDQLTVGDDILKVINQIAPAAAPATTPAAPATTPAATATTPATTPATPAQIRANKQKTAAAAAQAQMTTPATPAATPAQIRANKQKTAAAAAQAQMGGVATPAAAPASTTPASTTPAVPAKTANFTSPSSYGKTTTSFKPTTAVPSSAASATPPAKATKVTSGPLTPAEIAAVNEAVKYEPTSQNKALFLKLAQLAASAQRSADTPTAAPAGGQYQQTQTTGGAAPIAAALSKAGVNTNQLAALGSAIAPNAKLSTTGNPAVDALLKNMGFTVQ